MSFTVDDETAFQRRRTELGRDFAGWAERHGVEADPGDAQLLLDWKWGYGDGELGRWSVPELEEFLLEWCPRKVSGPPDLCAEIPRSVAAFMDFLAHRSLLAPGSQSPASLRRYCEQIGPRFQREMSDPAKFGMAKSLFPGAVDDALGGADTQLLLSRLQELTGTDPEELLELLAADTPQLIGPVRLPSPTEHLAAVRAAPAFRQVRGLAERCAAPGLAVTTRGNLRLADARRLVTELDTGDEAAPAQRTLQSTSELPTLAWVVELAVGAGAVARTGGRLVADPGFAELTEPEAFRRVVRAAVGLTSSPSTDSAEPNLLEAAAPQLLAELLDAHAEGEPVVDVADLVELVLDADAALDGTIPEFAGFPLMRQLERLVALGVLRPEGDAEPGVLAAVTLTPAGVTSAAELVPELVDIDVVVRPDPATADASTLADPLLLQDRDAAESDLSSWFAAQPDPAAAAAELLAELAADTRLGTEVLVGLDLAGAVLGEHADTAALAHRDGPHGPLVLTWLLTRGALDPATVDPEQLMHGMVTVAATMMDAAGPAGAIEFVRDAEREQVLEMMDRLWRLDHPRLPEVLDAIGHQHPDPKVAKAARRCLLRYRSRLAQ